MAWQHHDKFSQVNERGAKGPGLHIVVLLQSVVLAECKWHIINHSRLSVSGMLGGQSTVARCPSMPVSCHRVEAEEEANDAQTYVDQKV